MDISRLKQLSGLQESALSSKPFRYHLADRLSEEIHDKMRNERISTEDMIFALESIIEELQ